MRQGFAIAEADAPAWPASEMQQVLRALSVSLARGTFVTHGEIF
jgi:hypothetical protein